MKKWQIACIVLEMIVLAVIAFLFVRELQNRKAETASDTAASHSEEQINTAANDSENDLSDVPEVTTSDDLRDEETKTDETESDESDENKFEEDLDDETYDGPAGMEIEEEIEIELPEGAAGGGM